MTVLAKKMIDEILLLPREDRAELANKILQSLNTAPEDINEMWAKESERRITDYNEGIINAVDGEKVFNDIKQKLQK